MKNVLVILSVLLVGCSEPTVTYGLSQCVVVPLDQQRTRVVPGVCLNWMNHICIVRNRVEVHEHLERVTCEGERWVRL